MVRKLSISLPDELDDALAYAMAKRRESKSAIITAFLREHEEMRKYVKRVRAEPEDDSLAATSRTRVARAR